MVELSGNFETVSTENFVEFIVAIVKNDDVANKMSDAKPQLKITRNGDEFTFETVYPQKTIAMKFTVGVEFDDALPNGVQLKSTAALDGNKIVIDSRREGKQIGKREYEFSHDGLILTISAVVTPIVATRTFKRI